MKKFLISLFSFFLLTQLKAQFLTTDQTGNYADVEFLINNVLMDPAVSAQMNVSNIKLNGAAVPTGVATTNTEIGYYSNFASTAVVAPPAVGFNGFGSGLFLSTGEAEALTSIVGTTGAGTGIIPVPDSHLTLQLEGVGVQTGTAEDLNNTTTIEFDFVAVGSSVSFDYVFASKEYTQYTCAEFNDIFGFFYIRSWY